MIIMVFIAIMVMVVIVTTTVIVIVVAAVLQRLIPVLIMLEGIVALTIQISIIMVVLGVIILLQA